MYTKISILNIYLNTPILEFIETEHIGVAFSTCYLASQRVPVRAFFCEKETTFTFVWVSYSLLF